MCLHQKLKICLNLKLTITKCDCLKNIKKKKGKNKKNKRGLEYLVFPRDLQSRKKSDSTLLNFGERTRTGVYGVI